MKEMNRSSIRLFRAIPLDKDSIDCSKNVFEPLYKELLNETIKYGFVFAPNLVANKSKSELMSLIQVISKDVGITPAELNSTFHKSWQKVRDASMQQLFMEQMIHYLTTYGFEAMGIYNKDSVYIPNERLDIPELKEDKISLVVIKGLTLEQIKERLMKLLKAGVALKEETIKDVEDIVIGLDMTEQDLSEVKNKEVKILLYDHLNILPKNPTEFLRYIVYQKTGETLLIKSKGLIFKIGESSKSVKKHFLKYDQKYSLQKLASIFFRFKPLWLAMKDEHTSTIINKIRKLADTYHKPMPVDFLNNVTNYIKKGKIEYSKLNAALDKVNTFRKVRLAYALKYRTLEGADAIVYRIRNGKSYAKEFSFEQKDVAKLILNEVLKSIARDMEKNVKGKKIYIPEYINYALPATEKKCVGNFPEGTYISSPNKDLAIGVTWSNYKNHRIDLDFSMQNESQKFGWDGSYRNGSQILFSGDITDPRGEDATETFYVKNEHQGAYLFNLNFYNYDEKYKVPFKLFLAKEKITDLKKNYTVDPNNLIVSINSVMDVHQKKMGLLFCDGKQSRFYFSESSMSNNISSRTGGVMELSRKYMLNSFTNNIDFKDILIKAGAELVETNEDCDIDLSPEVLDKTTILNLLIKD